jgi:hypothetical protein
VPRQPEDQGAREAPGAGCGRVERLVALSSGAHGSRRSAPRRTGDDRERRQQTLRDCRWRRLLGTAHAPRHQRLKLVDKDVRRPFDAGRSVWAIFAHDVKQAIEQYEASLSAIWTGYERRRSEIDTFTVSAVVSHQSRGPVANIYISMRL